MTRLVAHQVNASPITVELIPQDDAHGERSPEELLAVVFAGESDLHD